MKFLIIIKEIPKEYKSKEFDIYIKNTLILSNEFLYHNIWDNYIE